MPGLAVPRRIASARAAGDSDGDQQEAGAMTTSGQFVQPQQYAQQPAAYPVPGFAAQPTGPLGKVRGTGVAMLLCIVTGGIYALFYFYAVHAEMKRHSGQGLGGPLGLVIALFLGIVAPFMVSSEVGGLYERAGRAKPVSGATGMWYFPGAFLVVGPIVWFVKTNGALNAYWRINGAR
jgi:hypothetical protein